MADIAHPLLGDSQTPRQWVLRKPCVLLTSLLFLAAFALCGVMHLQPKHRDVPLGIVWSPTNTQMMHKAGAPCLLWTGGTCRVLGCNKERGAVCEWGNCMCEKGCVGANGTCIHSIASYELVASNIRLRNVKYNEYLYTPRNWFLQQLRVTSTSGKYADRWNVYKVPGTEFEKEYHIISPVEYPGYAAGISANRVGPSISAVIVADMAVQDPWGVMQSLCRSGEHPEAWQIQNLGVGENTIKWYVHHGSWLVYGWTIGALIQAADVGDSGDWAPEPPVDLSLPSCVG